MTCTQASLTAAAGPFLQLTPLQRKALLVKYLYLQKNTGQVGKVVSGSSLLSSAACLDCGPSDTMLDAMEVAIQRQAAIDAGAAMGTFNAGTALKEIVSLLNLSQSQLRAIEILLRCQLA